MIVEDGSIVANANSLVSLSYANTYFSDRGNPTDWTDTYNSDREAALIYATAWLDQNIKWESYIQDTDQELGWPRLAFFDSEGRTLGGTGVIPTKVKDAICEVAIQWLRQDFTNTQNEGVKSESIGSSSITYSKATKSFSFVRTSLKEYGTGSSNVATTYRA